MKKIGILGGGQLGRMLCLAAANWNWEVYILDKSKDFPASAFSSHFVEGDFNNYDDVYNFGKEMDVVSIEIEHVNTNALIQLKKEGVIVHPNPESLTIIKDKGQQKKFYQQNDLPTATFQLYDDKKAIFEAIKNRHCQLPFVQKTRTAGYDGQGVALIKNENDLKSKLMDAPSVIEDLVDIDKEIAVIAARNEKGECICYPPVEMEFNDEANLVEFLACPADINSDIMEEATRLAKILIKKYNICGLLAVEFFLTKEGTLLINEVAPRTHNSGHHTIDSCYTSQFEQQLRAILNFPLGSTKMKTPSVMINVLGAEGYRGITKYKGIEKILAQEGAKIHLYGKTMTKPFRKMGHITFLNKDIEKAKAKARMLKHTLKVISQKEKTLN